MRGDLSEFQDRLLAWFQANKRDLPWRSQPSLYHTVVSEFMLQQTQVETVLPYFARWVARFPDFASLAAAPQQDVLKAWEGLGYYRRARNLQALAVHILRDGIPASCAQWRQLPGVGPYTAAAVASIARNEPVAVVDGNVVRILARLFADPTPIASAAAAQSHFGPFATALLHPHQPGTHNEAIMELGATICRKSAPLCASCPVRPHCKAFARQSQSALPVIPRKTSRARTVHRALVLRSEPPALLLATYPPNAQRLAGLSELPELPQPPAPPPLLSRSRRIANEAIREHFHLIDPSSTAAHGLPVLLAAPHLRFHPIHELHLVTLSGPHRKWLPALLRAAGWSGAKAWESLSTRSD